MSKLIDPLFNLINSLTKKEINSLSRKLKAQGQNNNLLLFKTIQKDIKVKSLNKRNYDPIQKHKLQKTILIHLRESLEERDNMNQLLALIIDINLLQIKKQQSVILKKIYKAKKIAYLQNAFYQLLQLIAWERDFFIQTNNPHNIETLNKEYRSILQKIEINWWFREAISNLKRLHNNLKTSTNPDEILKKIDVILNSPIVKNISNNDYYSLNLKFQLFIYHNYYLKNHQATYYYIIKQKEAIDLIHGKNKNILKNKLIIHINALESGFLAKIPKEEWQILLRETELLTLKVRDRMLNQQFLYWNLRFKIFNNTITELKSTINLLENQEILESKFYSLILTFYFLKEDQVKFNLWSKKINSQKNNFFNLETLHEVYLVEYLSLIEHHTYNVYYDFLLQKWSRCLQQQQNKYPKLIFTGLKKTTRIIKKADQLSIYHEIIKNNSENDFFVFSPLFNLKEWLIAKSIG